MVNNPELAASLLRARELSRAISATPTSLESPQQERGSVAAAAAARKRKKQILLYVQKEHEKVSISVNSVRMTTALLLGDHRLTRCIGQESRAVLRSNTSALWAKGRVDFQD